MDSPKPAQKDVRQREYEERLHSRRMQIRRYRQIEKNGARFGTYGFCFWHPVMGRITAVIVAGLAMAFMTIVAKNATPYVEFSEITQRALIATFVSFAGLAIVTPPPRAGLGFQVGLISGPMVAFCLWIGASIWHFVLDGNLASNEMLSAGIVLCTPLMMVFAYLCKLFSREPLIPRGEQFFFFRSGNLDDPPEEFSLPDQNLGWPLWPVIVTLLGLAFGAFQTAWAVFDFPRIKLF